MAGLERRTPVTLRHVLLAVIGIAVLALSSRVSIPMVPVPVTAQTLAVTVIAALYGPRLGVATVLAWLMLAALGAPLLAEGAAGIGRFTGPTGGYLLAFPVAAILVGGAYARGGGRRFGVAIGVMAAGNAICLLLGFIWLALAIGPGSALAKGLLPFLPGAALKSIVGAAIVRTIRPG